MPLTLASLFGRRRNADAPAVAPEPEPDFGPLIGHGYPENIQRAFLETTKSVFGDDDKLLPCTIMSRSPGGAGTSLIDEGYDLKGFKVKAKSCNWGPMAGFICQHPALNKVGKSKIGFNLKNHKAYLAWRKENLQRAPDVLRDIKLSASVEATLKERQKQYHWTTEQLEGERNKLKRQLKADQAKYYSPSPFQHLKISERRRREVFEEPPDDGKPWPFTPITANYRVQRINDDMWAGVGCSSDEARSVCVDFLLIRDAGETLWKVYYREVLVLRDDEVAYEPLDLPVELGAPVSRDVLVDVIAGGLEAVYDTLWGNLNLLTPVARTALADPTRITFNELHVTVNPYKAYTTAETAYLNSVSGDYDLFASWPAKASRSDLLIEPTLSMLTRVSELAYVKEKLQDYSVLFGTLGEQVFHIHARYAPNLVIDVIPDFAEIDPYEDHELGNIHDLGYIVSQVFNSIIAKTITTSEKSNRVFHSDEGGRPQIDEIEWPVGVFLSAEAAAILIDTKVPRPAGVGPALDGTNIRRCFALTDGAHDLFMWLVSALQPYTYVTLSSGWLCELCEVAMTAEERAKYKADNAARLASAALDDARADIQAWIGRRDAWHAVAANGAKSTYVRARLEEAFVGTSGPTPELRARQDLAFSTVLQRFVELIYSVGQTTAQRIQHLTQPIQHPGG